MKLISISEAARRRNFSRASVKHDQYKTPEYHVWQNMKARCQRVTHPCYHHYGGRGIAVCSRWESFPLFLLDMGPRPTSKHWLERSKNNEGYSPENCYWATPPQQMRNTRRTVLITVGGVTKCRKDLAIQYGINPGTVITRLRNGWSPTDALTTPIKPQYRNKYAKRK